MINPTHIAHVAHAQSGVTHAASPAPTFAGIQMSDTIVTLQPFAGYLGDLLGRAITWQRWPPGPPAELRARLAAMPPAELLIVGEPPVRQRRSPGSQLARLADAPLLLARQPRWPLAHILLVIRADGQDDTAVSWAGRLACASGARLTLLPAVPTLPPLYACHQQQAGLDLLLSPTTAVGGQVRRLADQILATGANGTLHLRHGEPAWQLRWEIEEGNPDLVVIAAGGRGWRGRFTNDLLWSLLRWAARPILITRGTQHE